MVQNHARIARLLTDSWVLKGQRRCKYHLRQKSMIDALRCIDSVINPALAPFWANAYDVDPALSQRWVDVLHILRGIIDLAVGGAYVDFDHSDLLTLFVSCIYTTRDIEPMLGQCWADVVDGGPTLTQHWLNVSCKLYPHTRITSALWVKSKCSNCLLVKWAATAFWFCTAVLSRSLSSRIA